MLVDAQERSGGGWWDPAYGTGLAEVDPTDDSGSGVQHLAEPERRLLFAILSDAIVRVRQLAASKSRYPLRRQLMEAERWIRSNDRSWPCSFVNVCEALGLAYEPLRRAVLRRQEVETDRRRMTRRGLIFKRRTRKRSAGAVPACAPAGVAAPAAATPAGEIAPDAERRGGSN